MCITEANQRHPLDTPAKEESLLSAAKEGAREFIRLLTGQTMVKNNKRQVSELLNEGRRMPR